MNIHDISILETQSPEKPGQVSCRCDAAGSLRLSPSPQDPAGFRVMGGLAPERQQGFVCSSVPWKPSEFSTPFFQPQKRMP